jgi:hypothetical protein
MSELMPQDLSDLDSRQIEVVREEQDRRLTPLFRRWPALSVRELAELRRVYDERLRVARLLGRRKRAQQVPM